MKITISILMLLILTGVSSFAQPHRGVAYFHQTSYSSIGTSGNYSLIITASDTAQRANITVRKTTDPTIKAIYYKNALTHGLTYYVLDTRNSEHLVNNDWGWILMDISNTSYRASIAADIVSTLNTYTTVFDGVFLDDVSYSITNSQFHREISLDQASIPPDLITNWKPYMVLLLDAIKTAIGSKLLIVNGGIYEATYIAKVDGLMDEAFTHPNWEGENTYTFSDPTMWLNHLATVDGIIGASKYFIAQSGVIDGATELGKARLIRFCLASYLMKVPLGGSQYYTHYFTPSINYTSDYWTAEWEKTVFLGNPTGAYSLQETNVYRRNFDKGVTLINLGSSPSSSINIGWKSVTVPAYDGLIESYSDVTLGVSTFNQPSLRGAKIQVEAK